MPYKDVSQAPSDLSHQTYTDKPIMDVHYGQMYVHHSIVPIYHVFVLIAFLCTKY